MRRLTKRTKKLSSSLKTIFILGFLFASQTSMAAFINSSFLSEGRGIPASLVGVLFTVGSILAIIKLSYASRLYERFGNKRLLIYSALVAIASLVLLVLSDGLILTAIAFVIYIAVANVMWFTIDLNVEHFTKDENSGSIRGLFLTAVNMAWIIFPFLSAQLIGPEMAFERVYIIAVVLLLLLILVTLHSAPHYKVSHHKHAGMMTNIKRFWHIDPLRKIFYANFLLQLFYAIMVIYTPIYLTQNIGIGWEKIGTIFFIMLLPFVLFEAPLGKLADTKFGEKTILSLGFIILSLSTISLSFITSTNWLVWAGLLFMTRVGASAVEVMSETFFYRHVSDDNAEFVSVFRDTGPLAYVVGPFVATILLSVVGIPLQYIFLSIGLVTLLGLVFSRSLKDKR
jgi:MFS family permease